MYTITENTLRTGQGFVPSASLRSFAGGFDNWRAEHKKDPLHFVVTEKQPGLQLTVSPKSDLPNPEMYMARKGRYVAATLVKTRHTTPAAIDAVARLLGVDARCISYGGLKDRTAVTSQMIVIEGVSLDHVRRSCFPSEQTLREHGFFLKDARPTDKKLSKGHLEGNRFEILLTVDGKSAAELSEYLQPRVNYLMAEQGNAPKVPNFFGRQRLGRRQNLMGVGREFILNGVNAGVKRFICEAVKENDHPKATEIRMELAKIWEEAEVRAANRGETVAEQFMCFLDMKAVLEAPIGYHKKPVWKMANMYIEHRLVNRILATKSMEQAVTDLRNDLSLSIGAYQGFWFNQVLGAVIDGKVPLSALDRGHNGEPVIPLYFTGDDQSVAFYKQVCPEAIPDKVDPFIKRLFLTNPPGRPGPRRSAFISVKNLEYRVHDGAVSFKFSLPSGSYATNFLAYLFELDQDDLEESNR